MPDHDKPESTPDYASMFSNFLPGQPSQSEQPKPSQSEQSESSQTSNQVQESDDFLAGLDEPTERDLKKQEILNTLERSGWTRGKSQEEIDAKVQELLAKYEAAEKKVEELKSEAKNKAEQAIEKGISYAKQNKLKIILIVLGIVLIHVGMTQLIEWLGEHERLNRQKKHAQAIQAAEAARKIEQQQEAPRPKVPQEEQQAQFQPTVPQEEQQAQLQPTEPQEQQQAQPQIPLEDPAKILARLAQKNRLNVQPSHITWASVESGLALPILKTAKTNDIAQALSKYTKKRCLTIDSRKTTDSTDIKLLYCVDPNEAEFDANVDFNTVWHRTFYAQTQDNVEFIKMYLSFAPVNDKSARIYKINHDYATVSEFRDVYGGDGEEDRISFKIYDIAPISWLDTQAIHMRIISDVSNSNETTGCFYENEHKNLHSYIFAGKKFRPVADWLEISVTKGSSDCEGQDPTASMTTVCQNAVLAGTNLSLSKDTCQ